MASSFLGGLANPNGKFNRIMTRVFDMLLLNGLFLLTSIPVVTAGASAAALYYAMAAAGADGLRAAAAAFYAGPVQPDHLPAAGKAAAQTSGLRAARTGGKPGRMVPRGAGRKAPAAGGIVEYHRPKLPVHFRSCDICRSEADDTVSVN